MRGAIAFALRLQQMRENHVFSVARVFTAVPFARLSRFLVLFLSFTILQHALK